MLHSTRIIAIDDLQSDLDTLEKCLNGIGRTCLAVKYESPSSIPTFVTRGVRTVFMDISLIPGGSPGDNTRNFTVIEAILRQLISDENGPYALVTWTDTNSHDALISYLRTRLSAAKQPFAVGSLDKNLYSTDPAALQTALAALHATLPQMAALLDWEKKVEDAAIDSIRNIAALAQEGAQPETYPEKLDELLSVMAVAAVGKENVGNNKFAAVNDALLPILYDRLAHTSPTPESTAIWDQAVTKHASPNLALGTEKDAALNTIIHMAPADATLKNFERGIILNLPSAWVQPEHFKKQFGDLPDVIMQKMFGLKAALSDPKWILVQVQAACDYANPKPAPTPFLLGLKIPAATQRIKSPKSLWLSPNLLEGTSAYILAVNYQFTLSLSKEAINAAGFSIAGRMRESLLNELVHDVHAYSDRPGIVSFGERPR